LLSHLLFALTASKNVNIKSEAQQKKLKTVRGSDTDLDISIHAKKGPEKSRDTLPLSRGNLHCIYISDLNYTEAYGHILPYTHQ
jgi:hypothetical protein